jgi:hypothetical protein
MSPARIFLLAVSLRPLAFGIFWSGRIDPPELVEGLG